MVFKMDEAKTTRAEWHAYITRMMSKAGQDNAIAGLPVYVMPLASVWQLYEAATRLPVTSNFDERLM